MPTMSPVRRTSPEFAREADPRAGESADDRGTGVLKRRTGVVFSLLGVLGIALILFVVVAATAGVVFGK